MVRIGLCQINVTVGDLSGNVERIKQAAQEAAVLGADLALFPELTVSGYPPEDLLLKPRFIERCLEFLSSEALVLPIPVLIGVPLTEARGMPLYNAAVLLHEGRLTAVYRKNSLPNYSVFDEKRYFTPGDRGLIIELGGHRLGVAICEDAWEEGGVVAGEAAAGADTILCLNASPFHRSKHDQRQAIVSRLCREHRVGMVYCNLIGGQDELVFDGGSFYMDADGHLVARGPEFKESVFVVELPSPAKGGGGAVVEGVDTIRLPWQEGELRASMAWEEEPKLDSLEEIYECLMLGVRDYVHKNGFSKVVIGSSGGIDSALTACVAVDALGAEHVTCVSMPSMYSSGGTKGDAEALSINLGTPFITIPIHDAFATYLNELSPHFAGREPGLTEENMQARLRAVYLMALANKFGWLVLNTSNKSEAAVGYGTMYGDMIGAYAVLKDVFKTTVFELAYYVNRRHGREVLPVSIIVRPPSAELRPDQKDSDSLPDYAVLDPILEAYIEEDQSIDEIIAMGFDEETVRRAARLTDINEWKRRQSVPGVRVSPKAFGKDRRLPITNRYQG